MLAEEIALIIKHKKAILARKIPDFAPICAILDKIEWFRKIAFKERELLIRKASVEVFEPGMLIFRKGDPSPNLFVIISGSVYTTTSKKIWGPDVIMNGKMFFDGEVFGEISDYIAFVGNDISEERLREL